MTTITNSSELSKLFGPYDDDWESNTRSIRISGKVTSIRLEKIYWRLLDDIAVQEGMRMPQLLTKLKRIATTENVEQTNFASFLRVCCCRFLHRLVPDTPQLTRRGTTDSDSDGADGPDNQGFETAD